MIGVKNQVYQGNCIDLFHSVRSESVDLVVTSPPYKEEDGYSPQLMEDMIAEVWNALKPNSLFFINFGHLAEDKTRPFKVLFMAVSLGFQLAETFVWAKNHYRPIQGERRVNNLTEFVFMLYKGRMPKLNRLSIGVPYKDKSNAKRFSGGRDLRCRGNLWEIPYETINNKKDKLHPDRFPKQLPEFCIRLSGIQPGSLVLDPFAGSATSCLAAKMMGMNYLGFELSSTNCKIAEDRLKES